MYNKDNLYSLKIKSVVTGNKNEDESCGFGIRQSIKIIGIYNPKTGYKFFYDGNEDNLLKTFWGYINDPSRRIDTLVGWSSKVYDFPMLYQRTLINKVAISNMKFPLISELQNYKNDNLLDASILWKCGGNKCDALIDVANALGYFKDEKEVNDFKAMADNYQSFYPMYLAEISNKKEGKAVKFIKDQLKFIWDITDLLV